MYASIHHYALLRPPNATQALRHQLTNCSKSTSSNIDYNCQTYLPFNDEAIRSLCNGGQELYASIHHHALGLLRPLNTIQDLRPPTSQHPKLAPGRGSPCGDRGVVSCVASVVVGR